MRAVAAAQVAHGRGQWCWRSGLGRPRRWGAAYRLRVGHDAAVIDRHEQVGVRRQWQGRGGRWGWGWQPARACTICSRRSQGRGACRRLAHRLHAAYHAGQSCRRVHSSGICSICSGRGGGWRRGHHRAACAAQQQEQHDSGRQAGSTARREHAAAAVSVQHPLGCTKVGTLAELGDLQEAWPSQASQVNDALWLQQRHCGSGAQSPPPHAHAVCCTKPLLRYIAHCEWVQLCYERLLRAFQFGNAPGTVFSVLELSGVQRSEHSCTNRTRSSRTLSEEGGPVERRGASVNVERNAIVV